MKSICLIALFVLCGTVSSRDSGESDSDRSDTNVDVLTEKQETTVHCERHCNCKGVNGSPTVYCCPDGKADPSQCPLNIISYGGNPGRYGLIPTDRQVIQHMGPVRSPGNAMSYAEYLDWHRQNNRADYATNSFANSAGHAMTYDEDHDLNRQINRADYATNNYNSRLCAMLGGCRSPANPSTYYTDPCISRNCKPVNPTYNRCTTRYCNPAPYSGCVTRNCNTASRCCRPPLATNHLRDAILTVVSQSYAMTKGEFISHIEAVLARQRELDWDPVMVRGSAGDNWPNHWPVYSKAGVPLSVDATDDADDDVTLEGSLETDQSV